MAFYNHHPFASEDESEFSSPSSDYYSSDSSDMSDTTRSTPHKSKSRNVTKQKVDNYKTAVQTESKGRIVRNIPFRRFVGEVLKLPDDAIKKIEAHQWTLSATHLDLYEQADTEGSEGDLHSPFITLSRILLAEVIQIFQNPPSSPEPGSTFTEVSVVAITPTPDTSKSKEKSKEKVAANSRKRPCPPDQPRICDGPHWTSIGSQRFDLTSGLYDCGGGMYFTFNDGKVKPKPDFVFYKAGPSGRIPIHKPQGNFFALVQRPGEFKKRHRSAKRIKLGPRKAASVSLATIPESGPSQTSPAIVNTASESKPVTDIAAPSTTQASAASDRASTGSKRKASESIATDERGEEPVSRLVSGVAADTGLTQDQAQLAVYAMACLSSNSRVYTTGLFVESWKVTTFYFDHMSILQCESFDFRAKPAWFAILIYAMHCSDNQNLGHLRFLRPWSRLEEKITEQMKEDLLYPVARMEGSVFDFPVRDSTRVAYVSGPDEIRSRIPDQAKQYVSLAVTGTISTPIGLIARATGVYKCNMKLTMSKFPSLIPSALKLSFQLRLRVPERDLIAQVRGKLPSWGEHLPEIYYSDIFTADELHQPSVAFVDEMQQRDLHVTASRLYRKLWELESVQEFQVVWIQCVRCHYLAFKEGKVLHRDLSENNVMFWRKKPAASSKETFLKGVLNDWDMASKLDGSEIYAPQSAAQHRTGTVPFMAINLLDRTPPAHYYRHDLESFLYILLWAALRYEFNCERKKLPSICSKWLSSDFEDVMAFKVALFAHEDRRKAILDLIPVKWQTVKTAWIEPLLDLFAEAIDSVPKIRGQMTATVQADQPAKEQAKPQFTEDDFFMWPQATGVGPDQPGLIPDSDNAQGPASSSTTDDNSYDYSTYNGRVTFKTFMKAIGQSGEDPAV